MSIDFTVMFKCYILISIIIILMRKWYTLVQNGKQEGVGAGNQEVSALLPGSETDITNEFLPHSRKNIILSHLLLESRSVSVTLREFQIFHMYCCFHCQENGDFSHICLFFFLMLSYCFHPISLFPLQLPCLLQQSLTQICMYTFGCFFRLYHCLHQPFNGPLMSFSLINGLVESHMNT